MNRPIRGVVVAFAVAAAACDGDAAGNDMARVSVRLTDAPGDLASAEVEIREIYLQGAGEETEGRVTLFSGSRTLDLLTLQNGVTEELADVTVPAGSYSQLRLVVGDARITTEGGATYSTANNTLQCPSCAQSGLKVNLPGGSLRLEDDAQVLVIDFDVSQSFGRAAGQSGRWVMRPVLAATKVETSGVIAGTVSLAQGVTLPQCGGAQVDLSRFVPTATVGDIRLTGHTTAAGALRFPFVAPGTYMVGFVDRVSFENGEMLTFAATPSAPSVTVSAGSTPLVNYSITSATCAAG